MDTKKTTIDKETLTTLGEIIDTAKRFRNSYFWSPPSNARGRRRMASKNSYPKIEWIENGNTYTAEYTVSCSCRYVYAYGRYTKNGKITNLTAIKNSHKRLVAS